MSKLGINLIVAVFAFAFGIASALAFNKLNADESIQISPSIHSDAMGNIRTTQD